jgi:hypothetical protein
LLAWTLRLIVGHQNNGRGIHVHGGPWLNLLAPLMFYLLAVRLAGRRAALGGLTLYLFFITGQEHSWAAATYSPWLFSDNFSEGLFFSAAFAVLSADQRPGTARAAIAGALMGVTFLAHTAPALILAIMTCALWYRRWRMLLVSGGAALLCALPFLGVIALHYHFHVMHAAPLVYQYARVSKEGFVETLRHNSWLIAAALAGLWIVRSRFLATWMVVAFALTLYAWHRRRRSFRLSLLALRHGRPRRPGRRAPGVSREEHVSVRRSRGDSRRLALERLRDPARFPGRAVSVGAPQCRSHRRCGISADRRATRRCRARQ